MRYRRAFSDKVTPDIDDFTNEPIVQCVVRFVKNSFVDVTESIQRRFTKMIDINDMNCFQSYDDNLQIKLQQPIAFSPMMTTCKCQLQQPTAFSPMMATYKCQLQQPVAFGPIMATYKCQLQQPATMND